MSYASAIMCSTASESVTLRRLASTSIFRRVSGDISNCIRTCPVGLRPAPARRPPRCPINTTRSSCPTA